MHLFRKHDSKLPVIVVLAMAATGCQVGPAALRMSNLHYSDAVRVASSEQMLVNLVRLRYRDLPVFLGVSSISTQFELATSGEIAGTITENVGPGNAKSPDELGLSGNIGYSERPTITFSIMGGEAFQQRMLAPLEVTAISRVAESGWRGDRVLRLTVEELNGLKNAPGASGPTPARAPPYRDFLQAVSLLRKLSEQQLIGLAYETRREPVSAPLPSAQVQGGHVVDAAKTGVEFAPTPDGERLGLVARKRRLVLRFAPASADSPDAARLRDLLRLKSDQMRFDIVALDESELDPFRPDQRIGELAVDTRSLMGVLYFLSNGVQPPLAHVEAGLVTATTTPDGQPFDWSDVLDDLFCVRFSAGPPRGAAVAVRHRGYWFYIADDDQTSKSTFLLLQQLFSLQAGQVEETRPVLTLPVGA